MISPRKKNQRLLTEALYSSWAGAGPGWPFPVAANVGLFPVPYYIIYDIYDPGQNLRGDVLEVYELRAREYVRRPDTWLPNIGLGVTLWQGAFEGRHDTWLRWCDQPKKLPASSPGERRTKKPLTGPIGRGPSMC
jgi:hypothetical protein